MKKYMVLYKNPTTAQQMDFSPEEKKKQRELWIAWEKKNRKTLVVSGIPLVNGMNITKDDISYENTNYGVYNCSGNGWGRC